MLEQYGRLLVILDGAARTKNFFAIFTCMGTVVTKEITTMTARKGAISMSAFGAAYRAL